jgi:hypothetical protein
MLDRLLRRLMGIGVALALLVAAVPCLARNGAVARLPIAGVKMKNGLNLEIDSRGSDANGYRPIKVKVTNFPPVPSKYDRQVRVTLKIMGYGAYGRVSVSQVLEIPEGATSAEAIISAPHDGRANYLSVEVREGGQKLHDLSSDYLMINTFGGWGGGDESFPSLLMISSTVPLSPQRDQLIAQNTSQIPETAATNNLPDVRNIMAATHDANAGISQAYGTITDRSMLSLLESSSRLEMLPPAEMPDRWIDLSTYSIAFISRGELKDLATKYPARKTALQEWLAGGCVLVVYDAGDDFQHLAEIEKLLQLAPRPEAGKKETPYRGWIPAQEEDKNRRGKHYGNSSQNYRNMAIAQTGIIPAPNATTVTPPVTTPETTPARKGPPFVSRPAQMGWLIAVPAQNPFPGEVDDWEWLMNSIPDQRESWNYRHGLSLTSTNDGFWDWHIAGVGAAPVFSFVLLATLFAIAIGPVNYLVLGRMQRLSMLLFTVPAGALLVTLALFLYAIVTDGLGVRTRVRSYTLIDQRSGQMVSWSRQSYFASIAPSRGLKFPEDTTVVPLVQKPTDGRQQYRAMDWEPDGQRLKSGFISSRSLQQYMVLRSGKSTGRLEVTEPPAAPRLQARNSLGTGIELLILRDSRGEYFSAPQFPQGATAEPARIPATDARTALTKLIKARDLEYPEGYDPTMSGNALTRMFRGSWMNSSSSGPVNTHVSLLERSFDEIASSHSDLLEPGTYLAVVEVTPDVPMGVTKSKQKESLHVIRGRW